MQTDSRQGSTSEPHHRRKAAAAVTGRNRNWASCSRWCFCAHRFYDISKLKLLKHSCIGIICEIFFHDHIAGCSIETVFVRDCYRTVNLPNLFNSCFLGFSFSVLYSSFDRDYKRGFKSWVFCPRVYFGSFWVVLLLFPKLCTKPAPRSSVEVPPNRDNLGEAHLYDRQSV